MRFSLERNDKDENVIPIPTGCRFVEEASQFQLSIPKKGMSNYKLAFCLAGGSFPPIPPPILPNNPTASPPGVSSPPLAWPHRLDGWSRANGGRKYATDDSDRAEAPFPLRKE